MLMYTVDDFSIDGQRQTCCCQNVNASNYNHDQGNPSTAPWAIPICRLLVKTRSGPSRCQRVLRRPVVIPGVGGNPFDVGYTGWATPLSLMTCRSRH